MLRICAIQWLGIALVLSCLILGTWGQGTVTQEMEGATEVSQGHYQIQEGHDLTLTCHFPNDADISEINHAILYKVPENSKDDSPVVIGSQWGLEKGFTPDEVPRYSLSYTEGEGDSGGILQFTITGVVAEDAGVYMCGAESQDEELYSDLQLSVISPPGEDSSQEKVEEASSQETDDESEESQVQPDENEDLQHDPVAQTSTEPAAPEQTTEEPVQRMAAEQKPEERSLEDGAVPAKIQEPEEATTTVKIDDVKPKSETTKAPTQQPQHKTMAAEVVIEDQRYATTAAARIHNEEDIEELMISEKAQHPTTAAEVPKEVVTEEQVVSEKAQHPTTAAAVPKEEVIEERVVSEKAQHPTTGAEVPKEEVIEEQVVSEEAQHPTTAAEVLKGVVIEEQLISEKAQHLTTAAEVPKEVVIEEQVVSEKAQHPTTAAEVPKEVVIEVISEKPVITTVVIDDNAGVAVEKARTTSGAVIVDVTEGNKQGMSTFPPENQMKVTEVIVEEIKGDKLTTEGVVIQRQMTEAEGLQTMAVKLLTKQSEVENELELGKVTTETEVEATTQKPEESKSTEGNALAIIKPKDSQPQPTERPMLETTAAKDPQQPITGQTPAVTNSSVGVEVPPVVPNNISYAVEVPVLKNNPPKEETTKGVPVSESKFSTVAPGITKDESSSVNNNVPGLGIKTNDSKSDATTGSKISPPQNNTIVEIPIVENNALTTEPSVGEKTTSVHSVVNKTNSTDTNNGIILPDIDIDTDTAPTQASVVGSPPLDNRTSDSSHSSTGRNASVASNITSPSNVSMGGIPVIEIDISSTPSSIVDKPIMSNSTNSTTIVRNITVGLPGVIPEKQTTRSPSGIGDVKNSKASVDNTIPNEEGSTPKVGIKLSMNETTTKGITPPPVPAMSTPSNGSLVTPEKKYPEKNPMRAIRNKTKSIDVDKPIAPIVKGPPVFDLNCPSEVIVGYRTEVIITCNVTSDLPINNTYFYWHNMHPSTRDRGYVNQGKNDVDKVLVVKGDDPKIILRPKKQALSLIPGKPGAKTWGRIGDYYGIVYQQGGATVMQLQIVRMHAQMYRTHFLVAQNEDGTTEHPVLLREDPSQPVLYSGSSTLHHPMLNLCVLLLTLVIAVYHSKGPC